MVKLISHRGNIAGLNPSLENSPDYIDNAIHLGYGVEIDVWKDSLDDSFHLGHDKPQYKTSTAWLLERKEHLWIHCKNFGALSGLIDLDLKIFYHQKEAHTIINKTNLIWSHNLLEADNKSIIPLLSHEEASSYLADPKLYRGIWGICSDFVQILKDK